MGDGFRALVVDKTDTGVTVGVREVGADQLDPGEVTVKVAYSSVNYKDGLAVRADGKVARRYPLVPGIDLSGTVEESTDERFKRGDRVLAHGYDIGVAHNGGYAEVARVPAGWVVPLPEGVSLRDAMVVGTAGFTAALGIHEMEHMGLSPKDGPVLVTGASGGVGSFAVSVLAARGYHVVASTGSADAHDYLRGLGAAEIIDRAETSAPSDRPMERTRWAGAVDAVGGSTLAYLIRTMQIGGSIASCGNTGGATVSTTVFPFILRGVNLLGIDSVNVPIDRRSALWQRIATDLRPPDLEKLVGGDVTLDNLATALEEIHRGATRGRVVVTVGGV